MEQTRNIDRECLKAECFVRHFLLRLPKKREIAWQSVYEEVGQLGNKFILFIHQLYFTSNGSSGRKPNDSLCTLCLKKNDTSVAHYSL